MIQRRDRFARCLWFQYLQRLSPAILHLVNLPQHLDAHKGGEEWLEGKLYGWTGGECQRCDGTGEDAGHKHLPGYRCGGCGGTGEGWGLMPTQPEVA